MCWLSECCDAPIIGNVDKHEDLVLGLCSQCKEWSDCYNDEEDSDETTDA